MHKKQSYIKGVKCNSLLGEKKYKDTGRQIPKTKQEEILMCRNCQIPVEKCKGTCVYRGA